MKWLFFSAGLAAFLVSCISVRIIGGGSPAEYLAAAEQYTEKGDYPAAVAAYEEHMKMRLARKERPEWENPYFYLLMIGDLELRQDHDAAAKKNYEEALEKSVEKALVVDRFRMLADWYAKKERYDEAIALLTTHEDLDPILMNLSLDRVARASVSQESTESAPR